jgi:hypothetical protein
MKKYYYDYDLKKSEKAVFSFSNFWLYFRILFMKKYVRKSEVYNIDMFCCDYENFFINKIRKYKRILRKTKNSLLRFF